ncbi:50S ribosomal protein L9 [Bacteroidetes bacterium endosymbiont of Geopemphigus sp.]|uniref:50S ribosomal protein L9 n=1 Tax=Bacteroidetes bacterium endosymbiont of Geopemphigus sp. TaxID=2047937 RepID=UPI000CD0D0F8|nr:50S ribosomal protein L9 [Bacteroidetes bacterium endosymbiont of Geopemphigus sp.]
MQIILKKDIENLGFQYEEINVKPGYARNYLIPQGYVDLATPSAKKQLQEILKQRAKKEASLLKQAQQMAEQFQSVRLQIVVKAGSGGKLFGSVNNQTLSQALMEQGIPLEKKFILIPGNSVKVLGKHQAKVRLHRQLEVALPFELVTAEEPKKKH